MVFPFDVVQVTKSTGHRYDATKPLSVAENGGLLAENDIRFRSDQNRLGRRKREQGHLPGASVRDLFGVSVCDLFRD